MLLSALVAMKRGIAKRNGETADLGHHMERHEKVEKDGKHARFSREAGRVAITRRLYLFRIEAIEDGQKLFVTSRDIGVDESVVQLPVIRRCQAVDVFVIHETRSCRDTTSLAKG